MKKLLHWLFNSIYQDGYWKGRGEGWFSCENLVLSRIKKHYPEQAEEMIEKLVL